MTPFDREAGSTDALLTDLYLDALLAGAVLDAAALGEPGARAFPGRLDPAARGAAERLRRDLVRVHPSFRFEERLATRLAEAAMAMRMPLAAGDEGRVISFRPGRGSELDPARATQADDTRAGADARTGPKPAALADADTDPDSARRVPGRPLLIGGALTSAAISIAGAAWVAWRLGRPGRAATPMARAARAVRMARLAAVPGGARLAPRRLD